MSIKQTVAASLLLLPQLFVCSTVASREFSFDQPALWYGDARGSGETGQSPSLSSDNWRLLLDGRGLQYVDRAGSEPREILHIPYDRIAAVRADPSERSYPVLIVDLTDGELGQPSSHVFMIMHPGSATALSAAMEAKTLIEDRKRQGPVSLAQAAQAAPSALEETLSQDEPRILDAVRVEKIAIAAAQWQPAVEVVREAARPESTVAERVKRYASNGAVGPGFLVVTCAQAACPPAAFVPLLGLTAVGAAGGAVVALATELVKSGIEAVSRPDALSVEAAQAAGSTIRTAAGDSISQSALRQCVSRKLASESGEPASVRWSDAERTASFSQFDGAGSIARDQTDAYVSVARDGHRYVIETFLSRVLLVPEGRAGRDASDRLARIVVEGGFRMFDLNGGPPREWTSEWRGEQHTLRVWSAADGAVLHEALNTACNGLAEKIVTTAEEFWRNDKEAVAAVSPTTGDKVGSGEI